MPSTYVVTVESIATDGTNLYLEVSVFDGEHTQPMLRPVFPVTATAATITAYLQTIANNRPALTDAIAALSRLRVTAS